MFSYFSSVQVTEWPPIGSIGADHVISETVL